MQPAGAVQVGRVCPVSPSHREAAMASTLKMFDNGTPEVSDPLSGFASIVRSIWQGVVCLAVELAGCQGRFPQLPDHGGV